MTVASKSEDTQNHLVELFKDFNTAMLVTRGDGGKLHGRPMSLAEVQNNGHVYFCTSVSGGIAKELENDPNTAVSVQGKAKFGSISGRATLTQDRALVDRLWKEDWKVWFPEGKEDPDLALVSFEAVEGQYWDNSGASGIEFVIRAAKAYIKGERPEPVGKEHNAKVKLD